MGALLGNTHIIEGGEDRLPDLLAYLERESLYTPGDADVYVRTYRHFGIDEARAVRARSAMRALAERRVFVLVAATMTAEAQNALLKTLEETPGDALFFILTPSPHTLLPTLRSRAQMLALPEAEAQGALIDAREFLSASTHERLDMLKPLLEKGEDDKRDIGVILGFLSSLERLLGKRKLSAQDATGLRAIYSARRYALDKGALLKPLLEQVALLASCTARK